MSLLTRAKEMTGGLANTSKRQAQRGKLEIEIRRLEGKVETEKQAIGDALFPLLEDGTVSAPGVEEQVKAIRALLDEIEAKRDEINDLRAGRDDDDDDTHAAVAADEQTDGATSAADEAKTDNQA